MSETFGSVEVEWFGHASVKLVDSEGFTVYVDPWSDVMQEGDIQGDADVIVITHSHFDHFDASMVNQLKKRNTVIICTEDLEEEVPKSIETKVIKPGISIKARGHRFKGVEAYNVNKFREPGEPFHPQGLCTGVVFSMEGIKFYHASDTDPIDEMKRLADENIEVAFLPVGGHYTMNQDEAIEAIKMVQPGKVVPIHFGVVDNTEADVGKFKNDVKGQTDSEPVVIN